MKIELRFSRGGGGGGGGGGETVIKGSAVTLRPNTGIVA